MGDSFDSVVTISEEELGMGQFNLKYYLKK